MMGRTVEDRASISSLFEVNGSGQGLMILIFPVLAGIFILRYIQSNQQSILIHSLPLRRQHILSTNLISGVIMLLVPIWVVAGFTAILSSVTTLYYEFSGLIILEWGLAVSIFTLFMFSFTVFVGVCIGQSILQGIVTYAFLIFPALMVALIKEHLSFYLKGFYAVAGIIEPLISPFIYMTTLGNSVPDLTLLLIYCGLTILFTVLSFGLYKLRQVENATQAIAFGFLKPVFRIVMMFGAALIVAEYFALQWTNWISAWTVVGSIIGGLIGLILAEMILLKTWLVPFRVLSKGALIYGTITVLMLYIPVASWNGYSSKIPAVEQIESVSMGHPYFYMDSYEKTGRESKRYSNDPVYVSAVHQLHEKLIETDFPTPSRRYEAKGNEIISIRYKLKDGGELIRNYNLPAIQFEQELLAIYNTNAYKYNENRLYEFDYVIRSITLTSELIPERMIVISDPQEMEEFKKLLKEEILSQRASLKPNDIAPIARITMSHGDDSNDWSGEIEPSFDKIRAWLKEKELSERLEVTPEQVEAADIALVSIKKSRTTYFHKDEVKASMQNVKKISIEDKAIISEILNRNSRTFESSGEQVFYVALKLKNGQEVYTMVREKNASTALKGLFK
jgi:ABC-2 type transport system permease protein